MKKYLKNKNWYSKTNKLLKTKYKNDLKLISGLIGATSPRFSVKRNLNTANNIYYDYIKDKKAFYIYFSTNKIKVLKEYKLLPAHYNNIKRVLIHNIKGIKKPLELSGLKVNAFYNNLIGNYEYITIDVWMLRFFNHKKQNLNKGDYLYYSKAIKKYFENVKDKYNLKYPCQLQAVIWEKIRAENGFKPSCFSSFI